MLREWFGSAVIGQLVNMARSYLDDRNEWRAGVRENLQKLERHLARIGAVVDLTQGRSIKNHNLEAWLTKLREAAYDAEDVLDVFDYKRLGEQVDSSPSSFSHRITKRLRTIECSFNFWDDGEQRLKEIAERFDRIAADALDFVRLLESGDCSLATLDERYPKK